MVNFYEFICVGEIVFFKVEVIGVEVEFVIEWFDKNSQFLDDSEYFFLNENKMVLIISNVLLFYVGFYYVVVKYVNEFVFEIYEIFQLEV